MKLSRKQKLALYIILLVFISANMLAFIHAWKFTHFTKTGDKVASHKDLTLTDKFSMLFFGVDNPKPINRKLPVKPYEVIYIHSNEKLECWLLKTENPLGTVIMFHGYKGEKSELLERAYLLNEAGYNTMLVDMMGAGGSTGDRVTIGYDEALNVRDCYQY